MLAHTQILIRALVVDPLLTTERADEFMRKAVATARMNVVSGPHSFYGVPGNEGVSTIVGLDLSSACLHEWPNHQPFPLLHFDLYTCGEPPDAEAFRALFEAELGIREFRAAVIDRDEFIRSVTA